MPQEEQEKRKIELLQESSKKVMQFLQLHKKTLVIFRIERSIIKKTIKIKSWGKKLRKR